MTKRWWWVVMGVLAVVSMFAVSCGKTPATQTTSTAPTTSAQPTQTTSAAPTTTAKTTAPVQTTAAPTTSKPAGGAYPVAVTPGQVPPWNPNGKLVTNAMGVTEEEPRYGGTMVLVYSQTCWNGFDPIRWSDVDGTAWFTLGSVYETLGLGDPKKALYGDKSWADAPGSPTGWHWQVPLSKLEGNLAESWEMSADLMTYTFRIQKGVRFWNKPPVNGREFTSADVKYVFDRHWGTGSGFTKPDARYSGVFETGPAQVDSTTCPDKYTFVIKWKSPSKIRMLSLVGGNSNHAGCMYPREILDTYGPTGLEDWRNMIGTGPFILQDYVADTSFTFIKNPNYWRYDELFPKNQLPYIDKLNSIIITDRSVAIAAFRVAKMDWSAGLFLQDEEQAQLLKTNPYTYFTYYPMESNVTFLMKMEIAPFKDVNVRRALEMGINWDDYRALYPGKRTDVICRPIMPPAGKDWWRPWDTLPAAVRDPYTYQPDRAKKLLTDAGYPNGFKTQVVAWPGDVIGPFVQAQWAKIGVTLEIKTVEGVAAGTIAAARSYDAMVTWQAHWWYVGTGIWEYIPGYYSPSLDENYIKLATEFYQKRDLVGDESKELIGLGQQLEDITLRDVYAIVPPPARSTSQPHHPWVKRRWCYCPLDDHFTDLAARMWIDWDLKTKMTGQKK